MNRYEGLFILDIAGKEDRISELIDDISKQLTDGGASVETVQRMEKKQFARVTDKVVTSGFYVNIAFAADAAAVPPLIKSLRSSENVYRVLIGRQEKAAA